jgi:4'-phosphopantetheinyl transferase
VNVQRESVHEHYWRSILSPEEVSKARRFRFGQDRSKYICTRGILRYLIGRIVRHPAKEIDIVYNEFGKPSLLHRQNAEHIEFNVAHSGDLALLAFSKNIRIGIDLEKEQPDIEFLQLAQLILSPYQFTQFVGLPREMQQREFYRCWTLKEAFCKAIGRGMSLPYSSFDLSFLENGPPRLLRLDSEPDSCGHWTLRDFIVDVGYVGALAVESTSHQLYLWEW